MITKSLSPKGRSVRVMFSFPAAEATESVVIAGSFNDWSVTRHAMALNRRRGIWHKRVSFRPGTRVEFRYLIDGKRWANEADADATAPTPYFSENSVLEL